jgi:hypothetical protein
MKFVLIFFLLFAGCTHNRVQEQEVRPLEGSHYIAVTFKKSDASLSSKSKKNIKKLFTKVNRARYPVLEIRILSWADVEYPEESNTEIKQEDILLAAERGLAIKDYTESEIKDIHDVNVFNMARRPDFLMKLLNSDEYVVKAAFEQSGVTATKLPNGEISYTKASKALIIIDYDDE